MVGHLTANQKWSFSPGLLNYRSNQHRRQTVKIVILAVVHACGKRSELIRRRCRLGSHGASRLQAPENTWRARHAREGVWRLVLFFSRLQILRWKWTFLPSATQTSWSVQEIVWMYGIIYCVDPADQDTHKEEASTVPASYPPLYFHDSCSKFNQCGYITCT